MVLLPQVKQQGTAKEIHKVNNAEPPHAYYQLDSGSVQGFPLHGITNKTYLFPFHHHPETSGEQVFASLAGINEPYQFMINGFNFGFGGEQGGETEFNITPFLRKDGNVVALEFPQSKENPLADLPDPVRIVTRDPMHVRDFMINSYVQPGSTESIVRIRLFIKSYLTGRNEGRSVVMRILDLENEPVGIQQHALDFPIAFRQEVEVTFDQTITDPHLWSPDDPALYSLQVQMIEKGDLEGEMISFKFGIRNIAQSDSVLVINQDTLQLNVAGIDVLQSCRGQTELSLIEALKANGFNAVQYQPHLSTNLMDQFDRTGILVLKRQDDHDPEADRQNANRPSFILVK